MKSNQPPDWRWSRARRLADNGLTPSRARDDRFVRTAWRFLKRLRRFDIKAEEQLETDYPELYEAFRIHDDGQSGIRWVFEAGVMANQPVEELAVYLRVDVQVLRLYEVMFFDVRDALPNRGSIISNVLYPFMTNSVSPRDPDIFWKVIAYFGKWEAVKSSWEIGHPSPEAIDFFVEACRFRTLKNAYDALHSVQINSFNAADHIKLLQDQNKQDQDGGKPTTGDAANASLSALLDSMALSVTPSRTQLPQEESRLQRPLLPVTIDVKPEKVDEKKGR